MSKHPFISRALFSIAVSIVCLCVLASEARAVWRAAGDVKAVARQTDGVVLTLTSGARVAGLRNRACQNRTHRRILASLVRTGDTMFSMIRIIPNRLA